MRESGSMVARNVRKRRKEQILARLYGRNELCNATLNYIGRNGIVSSYTVFSNNILYIGIPAYVVIPQSNPTQSKNGHTHTRRSIHASNQTQRRK